MADLRRARQAAGVLALLTAGHRLTATILRQARPAGQYLAGRTGDFITVLAAP